MARYTVIAASLIMPLRQVLLRLRRGYPFSPRQVDDFTVFLQEVELSFPVVSHHEDVDIVCFDVLDLLVPCVFGN